MDLIYELLSVARVEIKKTRLMYKTNMTHAQITKYLKRLLELDVIKEKKVNSSNTVYHITDKGNKLINALSITIKILDGI